MRDESNAQVCVNGVGGTQVGRKIADRVARPNWSLPYRPHATDNETDFCVRVGLIWDEYWLRVEREKKLKAQGIHPPPPFNTAKGYFKRQAYGLLTHFERQAIDRSMIKKLVTRYAFQPESPTFRQNFFHWGLIAVYLVEGVRGKKQVDSTMRAIYRMGREMLYARRNDVKPENLIGFIYQSACSKNIASRIKNNVLDPSLTFVPVLPR